MLGLLFKTNMRSAARIQQNVSQCSFYTIWRTAESALQSRNHER
jgi:hypothetical protein